MNVPPQQRDLLLKLYIIHVLNVPRCDRGKGRERMNEPALRYLNSVDPDRRLSSETVRMFYANVVDPSWNLERAKEALTIIEDYVLNLIDFPWKREFRKIMMYSGFYKNKVEPILKNVDALFSLGGYTIVGNCLELTLLPDEKRLHGAALELYLACVECTVFQFVLEKVRSCGVTLKDLFYRRQTTVGDGYTLSNALLSSRVFVPTEIVGTERFGLLGRGSLTEGETVGCDVNAGHDAANKRSRSKYVGLNEGRPRGGGNDGKTSSADKNDDDRFSHELLRRNIEGEERNVAVVVDDTPSSDVGHENVDEARMESVEKLLRDITPEMMAADTNLRKTVRLKLEGAKRQAASRAADAEQIHSSLPPFEMSKELEREPELRPHTEPIFIPKHSSAQPMKKEMGTGRRVGTEAEMRKCTRVGTGSEKRTSSTANDWECRHCFHVNSATTSRSVCFVCGCNR